MSPGLDRDRWTVLLARPLDRRGDGDRGLTGPLEAVSELQPPGCCGGSGTGSLVNRNFTADRPDALWVTDLTYVPTRSGMAYVCFIVDAYSRLIVGWRVAANMRTAMIHDALEMARRSRRSADATAIGKTCGSVAL